MSQWVVLGLDKKNNVLLIFDGKNKKKIKVGVDYIKKLMRWDKIDLSEGVIKLIKRSKPISVVKCKKLLKFVDKPIYLTIYGKLSEDGKNLSSDTESIEIFTPLAFSNVCGKEIVLEEVLLKDGALHVERYSRVFVKTDV